jgi:hypothetical protein
MTLGELVAALQDRRVSSDASVPTWTQGCFRRRAITYFTGETDTSTEVFWLQTRGLTVDLRLPARRPSPRALATARPEELMAMADYEGGLGHTRWDEARRSMSWSDWTALQLHAKWPEPGRLFRVGDCLIEEAPSGAYVEDWRLQPSADGLLVGLELLEERDLDSGAIRHRGGGLVVCGDHAALVRGRPLELAVPHARLDQHVRACLDGGDPAAVSAAFAFETSYARRGPTGFVVEASTQPWRAGQALLGPGEFDHDGERVSWRGESVEGDGAPTRVERMFTIDTLAAGVSFPLTTTATAAGAAWLAGEARTLRAHVTHPR